MSDNVVDPEWVASRYEAWKLCPYDPEFRDLCEALDELVDALAERADA